MSEPCEVVENQALGRSFFYCRFHKCETSSNGCDPTQAETKYDIGTIRNERIDTSDLKWHYFVEHEIKLYKDFVPQSVEGIRAKNHEVIEATKMLEYPDAEFGLRNIAPLTTAATASNHRWPRISALMPTDILDTMANAFCIPSKKLAHEPAIKSLEYPKRDAVLMDLLQSKSKSRRELPTAVGCITVVSWAEFMEKVGTRISNRCLIEYNKNIVSEIERDSDFGGYGEPTEWVRATKMLTPEFLNATYKNLGLDGDLREIDGRGSDLHEVIENGVVESMCQCGKPTLAVFDPQTFGLLIVNPDDFKMYLNFQKDGSVLGGLVCVNQAANLRIIVDWSKIDYSMWQDGE